MNPIKPTETITKQMDLTIYTSDSDIFAEYICLPGNQPQNNRNWIGIWEGTQILWDSQPIEHRFIENDNPSDALCIYRDRAPNMSYIIGYGSGTICNVDHSDETAKVKSKATTRIKQTNKEISIGTIGATIQVSASGSAGTQMITKVEAISIGNNTLVLDYVTPIGNIPVSNKNWVGIWPGSTTTFDGTNNLYRQEIKSQFNSDQICIQGFPFTIETTYTVAYATGPNWSDIVATVTFTTQGYGK